MNVLITEAYEEAQIIFRRVLSLNELSFFADSGVVLTKVDSAKVPTYEASLTLTPAIGGRVSVGLWNYYPEMGAFGLSHAMEDHTVIRFIDLVKLYGLSKDQTVSIGLQITRLLTGEDLDVTVRRIGRVFRSINDRLPDEHPLVYISRISKALQNASSTGKKFSEEDWRVLLDPAMSLFVVPWRYTPGSSTGAWSIEGPSPALREVYVAQMTGKRPPRAVTSFDRLIAQIGDTTNVQPVQGQTLAGFTAGYKSGASTLLSKDQASILNTAEIIKGSSDLLVADPEDLNDAPISRVDIEDIKTNILEKGLIDNKLIGSSVRRMERANPNFRKGLTTAMASLIDWEREERDPIYGNLLTNYLKYFSRVSLMISTLEDKI